MKPILLYTQTILLLLFSLTLIGQPTWNVLSSLPDLGRERSFSFSYENDIFIGGGRVGNSNTPDMWVYHTDTDEWEKKADFPGIPRRNAVAFRIGDFGYMGTGYGPTGTFTDFWKYDFENDTWSQLSDFLEFPISHAVGLSDDKNGYVAFGGDSDTEAFTNKIYKYSPDTDTWSLLTTLPADPRWRAFGFIENGKIYVGGGNKWRERSNTDFWSYDIGSDEWTELAHIPSFLTIGCYHFKLKGDFFVGAGTQVVSGGSYSSSLYKYDIIEDKWEKTLELPAEGRIFGISETVNDKAYVGLGTEYNFDKYFSDFYSFEIKPSSLQESDFEPIRIYPNPTHNILFIQNETTDPIINLMLYNQSGEIVKQYNNKKKNFEIDMSNLAVGSYILSIQKKNSLTNHHVTKI